MRLLFYSFCPSNDPSTVLRCTMMAKELSKHDIKADVKAYSFKESLTTGFAYTLRHLQDYDIICLHRHGSAVAYLVLTLARLMGKKVILDFDDALFVFGNKDVKVPHKLLNRWVAYSMLAPIAKASDAVTVGSHYLMDYAQRLNQRSFLIPTAIDTNIFKPIERKPNGVFTIGWVGNAPNHVQNIRLLVKPLNILSQYHPIKFCIISTLGNQELREMFPIKHNFEVGYGLDRMVDASLVPDLIKDFDVSVCPLQDNSFTKGVCAAKMLTSMAMGIPVVASPVGEHNYIVRNGDNGFLANNTNEWVSAIKSLMDNESLRYVIGNAGLKTIKDYTLEVQGKRFAEICYGLL